MKLTYLLPITLLLAACSKNSDDIQLVPKAKPTSASISNDVDRENVKWIIIDGTQKIEILSTAETETVKGSKHVSELTKIVQGNDFYFVYRRAPITMTATELKKNLLVQIIEHGDINFKITEQKFRNLYSEKNMVETKIDSNRYRLYLRKRHYLNASRCRGADQWNEVSETTISKRGNLVLYNGFALAMDRLVRRNSGEILSAIELSNDNHHPVYLMTAFVPNHSTNLTDSSESFYAAFPSASIIDSEKPWAAVSFIEFSMECDLCYGGDNSHYRAHDNFEPRYELNKDKICSEAISRKFRFENKNYGFSYEVAEADNLTKTTSVEARIENLPYINYLDPLWEVINESN